MPSKPTRRTQIKFTPLTAVVGIVVIVAVGWLEHLHSFDWAEYKVSDILMYWRPAPKPAGAVVIAAIDDKSIAELGHWPWTRNVMAQFEGALADYQVAVIGYDVLFSEADESDSARSTVAKHLQDAGVKPALIDQALGESNDQAFANAIKQQGHTVLGYTFGTINAAGRSKGFVEQGFTTEMKRPGPTSYNISSIAPDVTMQLYGADSYRPPLQVFNEAAHGTGFVSIDADRDGTMRAQIMVARFHDGNRVPLSLAVLKAIMGDANLKLTLGGPDAPNFATISTSGGEAKIPLNEHGQMLVWFRGPEGTFPHYSATDIINHRIPPTSLQGKVVLVGATARGLGDRFVTPMAADFPGVEIHANAIDNIIAQDVVVRAANVNAEIVAGLVLGILMVVAASFLPATSTTASFVLLAAVYIAYVQHNLMRRHRLIGIVYPMAMLLAVYLVLTAYRYWIEGREKRHLRHAFEHYLHPDVIASVVDNPSGLKLGGERRHMSILFADIIGFTTRAEKSDPEALVALLNTYMTKMTDVILETSGVVDKLMGDGIMAFWGAPNSVDNPARLSIDCALRMLQTLDQLRKDDERFHDLDIGVGIATGEAIAGNFGGENRFDYSVIGDVVNFASRLEGLTRKFKVHLLVSKQTLLEAASQYITREIGIVKVKGKSNTVPIVEVVAQANDGADPAFYQRFAHVSELLHMGDATAAKRELASLQTERPDDGVIHLYLEKLAEGKEPPREMLFEFESK